MVRWKSLWLWMSFMILFVRSSMCLLFEVGFSLKWSNLFPPIAKISPFSYNGFRLYWRHIFLTTLAIKFTKYLKLKAFIFRAKPSCNQTCSTTVEAEFNKAESLDATQYGFVETIVLSKLNEMH